MRLKKNGYWDGVCCYGFITDVQTSHNIHFTRKTRFLTFKNKNPFTNRSSLEVIPEWYSFLVNY